MHRVTRRALLPTIVALVVLAAPALVQPVAAGNSTWLANCSVRLRSTPSTTASTRAIIDTNASVTASGTVSGGRWSATCGGRDVAGTSWLKIVAVGGRSTSSLYGVSAVYAASGLFRPAPPPTTDAIANCDVRLRTSPSTRGTTKVIIPRNTVVTTVGTVPGSSWSATCVRSVSGSRWYKIVAVGGRSVSSLYGVSALYAATGLFRAPASTYLEGIDVSSWQGSIDFARVRGAGKRFVIAKASEGIGYEDARYDANKRNALANGLVFGAYHFARPGSNNPVTEADWFVATAGQQRGMLIPTLDLERTGGLGPAALTTWVKAWLNRVHQRLGVRAMIYTSPAFWRTYMADTRWFADNGYAILWTAHWNVSSPSVPGSNWGGRSWTFWQYSDCGSVPGISGCVDLNRYRYADLKLVTY